MVSRKVLLVLLVAGLVALVPVAGVALLLAPPAFMYSHYNHYDYTTSISVNGTVENVTVYLPFPTQATNGSTVENLWIYDHDGTQLTDWEARVVDTPRGRMLALHVDRLEGADGYVLYTYAPNGSLVDWQRIGPDEIPADMTNKQLVADPTTYSISWGGNVEEAIETRYPIGNGSFIVPATNVTRVGCTDAWGETDTCFTFDSTVYATYEADGPTTVTVGTITFDGWNEWGFALSNSFNTFSATTDSAVFAEGRQGWRPIDGTLHGGMGRYDGPAP